MGNKYFTFWQKWLTYANVLGLIMGLLIAFAGNSLVFDYYNEETNNLFFQGDIPEGELSDFKNWLWGIIGATIAGFHALMIGISENAFKRKKRWAFLTLWMSLLIWFFIDSSISLFYGALHNVILVNLTTLVLISIPLIITRKAFPKQTNGTAYVIVHINITDSQLYESYKKLTPAILAAYDGKFIVRGGETELLEGNWQSGRVVVLEFPNSKIAKEWWNSEIYSEAKSIRQRSAETQMILVEGI